MDDLDHLRVASIEPQGFSIAVDQKGRIIREPGRPTRTRRTARWIGRGGLHVVQWLRQPVTRGTLATLWVGWLLAEILR